MCEENYGRIKEPREVVKAKSRLILLWAVSNFIIDVVAVVFFIIKEP